MLTAPSRPEKHDARLASESDGAEVRTIWPSWQSLRRRLRGEQILACALAAPALLGTQPAVLVVMGVALALLGAFPARDQAGLELVVLDPRVGISLAGEDARGRDAGVGAVEAEAQAALEVADLVLGERCVGADRAVRGAAAALVDAPSEHAYVDDERPRVGPRLVRRVYESAGQMPVASRSIASWRAPRAHA